MTPVFSDGTYTFSDAQLGDIQFHTAGKYEAGIDLQLSSGMGNARGLTFARDCVTYMFNKTPCLVIHGFIEQNNRASSLFGNALQFDTLETVTVGGVKYIHRRVTISQWVKRRGQQGNEDAGARRPERFKR